jgi:restriction endonuclease Mrr
VHGVKPESLRGLRRHPEICGDDRPKVNLMDGSAWAELMIDHDLGTTTTATYAIKRIHPDYFGEE